MLKNIIIVGCGYIGKKVARLLMQKKLAPSCLVNTENSQVNCQSAGLNCVRFDLDNQGEKSNAPSGLDFEKSVIAYFVPPQPQGDIDYRMHNFVKMLDALALPPEKILLISTTGVYGNCHGEWIDETRPPKPQVDRARRRLSAETRLADYCEENKTQLVVFRVAGIYAADKLPIKRICSAEPIVNAQDSGYTNRIHAQDLARFCVEALCENVAPGIYNCCDGQPSTMNDYFMKVADAMSLTRPKEISLQQAQQELSAGMLSYLAESKRISNEKLIQHFKTRFNFPNLDAGLSSLNNSDE